jgi:hypothetical protein
LRRGPLKHVKDVKVHTTYFLPVEASKVPVSLEFIAVLEFISSRSPLFFFVSLLQCHQQPTGSRLYGFYCAYHMLQLKYNGTHMKVLSWDLHL